MEETKKIPAPININNGEVAVHLAYIRRDIDEIKVNQDKNNLDLKESIKDLKNGFVTHTEFAETEKITDDHENRIRTIEKNMWKWIGMSSIISSFGGGIIIALIEHFLK